MIYIHDNNITIIASKKARTGVKYNLNGQEYLVVDRKLLEKMISSGKDVSKVVTTRVDSMVGLFSCKSNFNQDISSWDVSRVKSMTRMFSGANKFNQDISFWDVSNVYNFEYMFSGATSFNCDISNWKLNPCAKFTGMFSSAYAFNQPIGKWNINFGYDVDIAYMFMNAKSFNQSLNSWNVDEVRSFISLFEGAESFNQDIYSWNVKGSLNRMFKNAKKFNSDITSWKFSSVNLTEEMFYGAESFNQDISGWDVSKVINMNRMFNGASSFNQNINCWKINPKLKEKKPSGIFVGAKKFNPEYSPFEIIEKKVIKKINKDVTNLGIDYNSLQKIKKLINSRDFDKIDLAIELIKSLNNHQLYNTLLEQCKLETIDKENILHTNEIFTCSTKRDQYFLNYALMIIISIAPQNDMLKIDESLILKNITYLNLNSIISSKLRQNHYLDENPKPKLFNLENFKNLNKIDIDFEYFSNLNFQDILINDSVSEINAKNVKNLNSIKNLSNLKELKADIIKNKNYDEINYSSYFSKLEKLCLYGTKNINLNFLNNCNKLKKISLSELSLENIDELSEIKKLIALEELYIGFKESCEKKLNLDFLNNLKKLRKITIFCYDDINNILNAFSSLSILHNIEYIEILGVEPSNINMKPLEKCINLLELKINISNRDCYIKKNNNYEFNFSGIENCKKLELFEIRGYIFKNVYVKNLSTYDNINLNNIKIIDLDGFQIINSNEKIQTNIEELNCDNTNLKIIKTSDFDNIHIADSKPIENKTYLNIKNLLTSRDINKIDMAIELIKSINNYQLFNKILDGCKYENNSFVTNKLFTGTQYSQPSLYYGLLNIISSIPKDKNIKIHKSILLENIEFLDLEKMFPNYYKVDRIDKIINLENFYNLREIKINFNTFNEIPSTFLKNNFNLTKVSAVNPNNLIWFKNCVNLRKLSLENVNLIDLEFFNYLTNLEELTLSRSEINNLDFLSNCRKIKKIKLYGCHKLNNLYGLSILENLRFLEHDYGPNIDLGVFSKSVHKLERLRININKELCLNFKGEISNFYGFKGLNSIKKIIVNDVTINT